MKKRRKAPGPSCDLESDGDPKREGYAERFSRDMALEREVRTFSPPGYVRRAMRAKHKAGKPHNEEWCPICLREEG